MTALIDKLCWWLVRVFPKRHRVVVTDGEDYLLRFYIKHNGVFPGIYLHKFFMGDKDRHLHNHPWRWSFSLVLTGGYDEERLVEDTVKTRRVSPGRLNLLTGNTFHRISLVDAGYGAWTLFCSGPKVKGWGFLMENGDVIPQEDYLADR